eukprot:RCo013381
MSDKAKALVPVAEAVLRWNEELSQVCEDLDHLTVSMLQEHELSEEAAAEISAVEGELAKAEMQHEELDQKVGILEAQQGELQQSLAELEALARAAGVNLSSGSSEQCDPQVETLGYGLASKLNEDTLQLQKEVNDLVQQINAERRGTEDSELLNTFVEVMANHVESIQWINNQAHELQQALEEQQLADRLLPNR